MELQCVEYPYYFIKVLPEEDMYDDYIQWTKSFADHMIELFDKFDTRIELVTTGGVIDLYFDANSLSEIKEAKYYDELSSLLDGSYESVYYYFRTKADAVRFKLQWVEK